LWHCSSNAAGIWPHRTKRPQLALDIAEEQFNEQIEVRELRNVKPPEYRLVAEFYRHWSGTEQEPTAKEMTLARRWKKGTGTGPICAQHPSGRSGKLDLSPFSRPP